VTKEDLIRYVDDRLPSERRSQVAAYLHEHPETAEELEAQKRLNALLRECHRCVREEPIPPALLHAAAGAGERIRPRREALRTMVLASTAVIVGGVAGWLWRSVMLEPQWQNFTRQAAAAHRVYASERDRPVELAARQELLAWLSRRLGIPITAPRLDAFGYRFIGGRLLPGAGGTPAAQLRYESAEGTSSFSSRMKKVSTCSTGSMGRADTRSPRSWTRTPCGRSPKWYMTRFAP
jgi:anti-sigma factor RsiW